MWINKVLGLVGGVLLGFGIFHFAGYAFESIAFIAETGWDVSKLGPGVYRKVTDLPGFPTQAAIVLGLGLGLLFARSKSPASGSEID